MSRILRRPMFRGGRVSSYGTGIASGLADGGMPPKRGLVDGPGGYAGTTWEDLISGKYNVGISGGVIPNSAYLTSDKEGEEIVADAMAMHATDEPSVTTEKDATLDLAGKQDEVFYEDQETEVGNYPADDQETETETEINTTDEYIYKVIGREKTPKLVKNPDYEPPYKTKVITNRSGEERVVKVPLTDAEIEATKWTPGVDGIEHIPKISDTLNIHKETEEVKPEIDARTVVAENKALFADLLGLDKARGQDIGDMLIGASAKLLKPGATVKSGLGEFMEAESQRPGRRRKIEDTAAGLAIQDYIAGKRSKEQIKGLRSKIDYDYEQKLKLLIPQKSDSLEVAQLKLASRDISPSSDKGLKHLINIQDDTEMGNKVYPAKKGVKLKDVTGKKAKVLKKLLVGYNIITDENLGKVIIKYDGSGTFGGVQILDISEIWAGV